MALDDLQMNLSDEAKIEKYIKAFEMNQEFFEGKVVLNVGCGHGLLSMLAAKVKFHLFILVRLLSDCY